MCFHNIYSCPGVHDNNYSGFPLLQNISGAKRRKLEDTLHQSPEAVVPELCPATETDTDSSEIVLPDSIFTRLLDIFPSKCFNWIYKWV